MNKTGNTVVDGTFREILESIPEAVMLADRDGIIQVWNVGAEQLFGFTAEEAVGQSLDLIVPEGMRKPHWDGYHRAVESGETKHKGGSMITRSLQKNGERLYIDVSFAMVKNAAGEVIGSAAVARDATERFLKEKAQQQASQAVPAKPEKKRLQSYSAPGITVGFDPNLCYHSAICLKDLPAVFDVHRKRWIKPELASIEEVIATIEKCPSGALTYVRDGQAEPVAESDAAVTGTSIQACPNGPLHVQGDFKLLDENGNLLEMPGRAALCRCGATGNQPFCDNSHQRIGFRSK